MKLSSEVVQVLIGLAFWAVVVWLLFKESNSYFPVHRPPLHGNFHAKPKPLIGRKDTMPPPPLKPRAIIDPDKVIKVEPRMVKQQFWP